MTKSSLQKALERAEIECSAYSGRFMNGKKCLAVRINESGMWLAAQILWASEYFEDEGISLHHVAKELERTQQDSLGRGFVYYWPHVEYVESDESACDPE